MRSQSSAEGEKRVRYTASNCTTSVPRWDTKVRRMFELQAQDLSFS